MLHGQDWMRAPCYCSFNNRPQLTTRMGMKIKDYLAFSLPITPSDESVFLEIDNSKIIKVNTGDQITLYTSNLGSTSYKGRFTIIIWYFQENPEKVKKPYSYNFEQIWIFHPGQKSFKLRPFIAGYITLEVRCIERKLNCDGIVDVVLEKAAPKVT